MSAQNGMDKRQHPRMDKTVVLQVATPAAHLSTMTEWTLVTSKNISAGGVLFAYDRSLEEGTPLAISIHFPKKTIHCEGVVHRTSPSSNKPLVNVAARLVGFRNNDRDFIESFPG